MGSVKIKPEFTNFSKLVGTTPVHISTRKLQPLLQNIYDQWYDLVGGTGQIQITVTYRPSTVRTLLPSPLHMLTVSLMCHFSSLASIPDN